MTAGSLAMPWKKAAWSTTCASSRTVKNSSITSATRANIPTLQADPRPGLILLDLNMPRKDGRTALKEMKPYPDLRQIPVTVLTTSKADEDIFRSYDLGVNSYIVKPVTFEALVDILQTLEKYWFEIVELPPDAIKARQNRGV